MDAWDQTILPAQPGESRQLARPSLRANARGLAHSLDRTPPTLRRTSNKKRGRAGPRPSPPPRRGVESANAPSPFGSPIRRRPAGCRRAPDWPLVQDRCLERDSTGNRRRKRRARGGSTSTKRYLRERWPCGWLALTETRTHPRTVRSYQSCPSERARSANSRRVMQTGRRCWPLAMKSITPGGCNLTNRVPE